MRSLKILLFLCVFSALSFHLGAVDLTTSNLPIICIDTNGKSIPDEPKIEAQMCIYWQPGSVSSTSDDSTNYEGYIGIEKRGNSSQTWPKKPYKVETRNADGSNLNISLIGLPKENDWVFHAPYVDKTLLRNALIYRLLNEMGWYAPRYRFCELILNDDYQGVYVLIESLKVDEKRLDLTEASATDLSGSYLLELTTKNRLSKDEPYLETDIAEQVMAIKYPADSALTTAHRNYITSYMNDFEKALSDKSFSGTEDYKNYIDIPSFIDHMLVSEVVRQLDVFCASHHFYKDAGGKLVMGPGWDFNRSIGNYKGHDEWKKTGFWMTATRGGCKPFWSWHIYEDDSFMKAYKARYAELRNSILSTGHIYAIIDEYSAYLDEAKERNFKIWDIDENRSHKYVQGSYTGEIDYVKSWLEERMTWLDQQWGVEARPYINEFYPDGENSGTQWVELYNPYERTVDISNWQILIDGEVFTFPDNTTIAGKDYLVIASDGDKFKAKYSAVKTVLGGLRGNLCNDRLSMVLKEADGRVCDSICTALNEGWPLISKSGNYAVALRPIAYDNACGASWNWSLEQGGTPGEKNDVYAYEGLLITEIMTANSSALKDDYRDYDDWIELTNTSNYSINLCGLFLSDKLHKMDKWTIKDSLNTGNTLLSPGQSTILWLDKDDYQGNLHANFSVSASGERVLLSYHDGYVNKLIDQVYPPALMPDESYLLSDLNTGEWQISYEPTPGYVGDAPSGIDDLEQVYLAQLSIYPNPVRDRLSVDFNLKQTQGVSIQLLDYSGRVVAVLLPEKVLNSGHYTYHFALRQDLPGALYVICLRAEGFVLSEKVVIRPFGY